jgi:hypothetical protein
METPLDVLSRAASLVHADDEKRKLGILLLFIFNNILKCINAVYTGLISCAILKSHASLHGFMSMYC